MKNKKWWTSKTLWVNALAFAGILIQKLTGQDLLDAKMQVQLIVIINVLLRLITDSRLKWR